MPRKNDSAPNHAASRVGIIRKSALCRLCRARHKRHTFATRLLDKGVPLNDVQYLMGHKRSASIMRRYCECYGTTVTQ